LQHIASLVSYLLKGGSNFTDKAYHCDTRIVLIKQLWSCCEWRRKKNVKSVADMGSVQNKCMDIFFQPVKDWEYIVFSNTF